MRCLSIMLAALTIPACSGESPSANTSGPTSEKLVMRAGQIISNNANPRQLRGSFQLVPAQSGPDPLESLGSGGACLIVDLNAINIPSSGAQCTSDAQCSGGMPQGGSGYCVQQRCGVRPGPPRPWCDRSADHGGAPFPKGQHWLPPGDGSGPPATIDVSAVYALPGAQGRQFDWRVHSCLNGLDSTGTKSNAACGGGPGQKQVDDGPVTKVG